MALTLKKPDKIHLSGPMIVQQDDYQDGLRTFQAVDAITPGHLVDLVLNGTELNVQKNANAGAVRQAIVALNYPEINRGVDDVWAIGETVRFGIMGTGCVIWGLITSGQDIDAGDYLDSAGDGTWREDASTDRAFISLDSPGAVVASTRIRVMRVK